MNHVYDKRGHGFDVWRYHAGINVRRFWQPVALAGFCSLSLDFYKKVNYY
jgi:hypothetical protein